MRPYDIDMIKDLVVVLCCDRYLVVGTVSRKVIRRWPLRHKVDDIRLARFESVPIDDALFAMLKHILLIGVGNQLEDDAVLPLIRFDKNIGVLLADAALHIRSSFLHLD